MAFSALKAAGFDVQFENHAAAILDTDFYEACVEIESALLQSKYPISELIASGGGEAEGTQRLRSLLGSEKLGWGKQTISVTRSVNGVHAYSDSHEVDHVKEFPNGRLAIEIEWNNKDPFFDRDLATFKVLHVECALSVGIIVTRGSSLTAALPAAIESFIKQKGIQYDADWLGVGAKRRTDRQASRIQALIAQGTPWYKASAQVFLTDKFGTATTHWAKLQERISRRVGSPCPLALIGLPASVLF